MLFGFNFQAHAQALILQVLQGSNFQMSSPVTGTGTVPSLANPTGTSEVPNFVDLMILISDNFGKDWHFSIPSPVKHTDPKQPGDSSIGW